MKLVASALAATLLLMGCSMTSSTGPDIKASIADKEWELAQIDADAINTDIVIQIPNFTLESEGRITGTGGCNRFFGDAALEGNHLVAPQLASTKMMCIQNEVATIENQLMSAFNTGVDIQIKSDNEILLTGKEHNFIFRHK